MKTEIVVALAGNPNSGKSTIFNNLTGIHQHVGNYPGVTVEKKEGICRHKDIEIKIVDLPGTYSLTAYSAEEVVARNFIIEGRPDMVVDIIDSSNLERNLYLAVQLLELQVPLVLAFNMSDTAKARGHIFDIDKLSLFFGSPIVQTVGNKRHGMQELLDTIISTAANGEKQQGRTIKYGFEIEREINKIEALINRTGSAENKHSARWSAVKLLEHDKEVGTKFDSPEIEAQVGKSSTHIEKIIGENPETAIAGRRYAFISGACREAVHFTVEIRHTISDKIDAIVTNRILSLPIFLGLMYLVFYLTFALGAPPMRWIESAFDWLGGIARNAWPVGSESALQSLIADGIIGGAGAVIVFLPNVLLLFLAIAILEDSGYMARAAFIMDRLMHKIGLHGRSFIPMLVGFGCSVPAIMATRTLENRRDRLATMLVIPLMSCSARLTIYTLIIPAFFPQAWQAPMLWVIYLIGIALAIASVKLLRSTVLKGESVPFVMELPLYRMPTLKGLFVHTWERGWLYVKKAGTIILGLSIVLWVMTSYPKKANFDRDYTLEKRLAEKTYASETAELNTRSRSTAKPDLLAKEARVKLESAFKERISAIKHAQQAEEISYSIAGRIGHAIEPLLKPMGFDWRIGTSLIGALAAKEVFVAQMGIIYSVAEMNDQSEALRDRLKSRYSPLTAFCIMLFSLISAPCLATIAVTKKESNSWKWALFQFGGLTVMAYVLTVLVFQVGSFISSTGMGWK